jgi:hypothetical protein
MSKELPDFTGSVDRQQFNRVVDERESAYARIGRLEDSESKLMMARDAAILRAETAETNFKTTRAERNILDSALERTLANFKSLLAGKPVRDVAETIAEAEHALNL